MVKHQLSTPSHFDVLNQEVIISNKEKKLLQVVTKQTVLITTSFLSPMVTLLIIIIFGGMSYVSGIFVNGWLVVLTMTLWLSYSFADKYYLFYCKLCHQCCWDCCQSIVTKRQRRRLNEPPSIEIEQNSET